MVTCLNSRRSCDGGVLRRLAVQVPSWGIACHGSRMKKNCTPPPTSRVKSSRNQTHESYRNPLARVTEQSSRQFNAYAASFLVNGLLSETAFSSARKRSRISSIVALGATLRKSSSTRWLTTSLTVLSEGMWRERVRRNVWQHPHTCGENFSAINCNKPKAIAASMTKRSQPSQQLWTCCTSSFVGCLRY